MSKTENNNTTPSLNSKITALNEQIAWFYSDDFSLDQALKNYQEAISLANEITADLQHLQNEIQILSKNFTDETNNAKI